jgi:peroxiredoxin
MLAAATLLSGQVLAQKINLKGTVYNNAAADKVYLYSYFGTELNKKDSAKVVNSQVAFEFKKGLPRGFYRVGLTPQKSAVMVLGKEANVEFKLDFSNTEGISFDASQENALYKKYNEYNKKFGEDVNALQKQASGISKLQDTEPARFEAEMTKLKASFDSLTAVQNEFYKKLNAENGQLFVGKVAGLFATTPKTDSSNYFRKEDFTDVEFLSGDMLSNKINIFYQRFVKQDIEGWKNASKQIVAFTPAKSDGREVAYMAVINLFNQFDPGFSRQLAEAYVKDCPKSARAKNILARMPRPQPSEGDVAPDITLQDRDGKEVSLSSLKGKVVLIDFWASWCGPCRAENPNVVKAYEKYKDKGFTIFSVSLDDNKDRWLQAIEKDKLTWPSHVSDLKGWRSAGAALYSVSSIPATFLLDRNGKIIGKNLRGSALEDKLKSVLQ